MVIRNVLKEWPTLDLCFMEFNTELKMSRKHFQTFDALRFFSFLLVFLFHLPKTGNSYADFFLKSGGIGVLFFFVLSGFLITYILLYDKECKNKISLKNFFVRRILRIWPLFYLMIAFAYLSPFLVSFFNFHSENKGYAPDLLVSLFFGENYKMMITDAFPDRAPLSVMWSLCIEEHFYILWGVLLYFLSVKKIPLLIILSIIIANIVRPVYTYFGIGHFDVFTHLDYFAFGAIPAYFLIHKKDYMDYVEKIPLQLKYVVLTLTVAAIFIIPNTDFEWIDYFSPCLLGLLFSITILFTLGKNAIHINDNLLFSKLGIYTYGLYLYHTIIIILLNQVFRYFSFSNWLVISLSSLLLTIVTSVISYNMFENQFLKLKRFFY